MAINVNGVGPGQVNNRTGSTSEKSSGVNQPQERPVTEQGVNQAGGRSDSVSLSQQSQELKSLESRLADYPEVDDSRVAEIREALDNGSYKVDAEKLAQKMLDVDQGIFG